ncbi:hypothetical protein, partial [Modestobacter marinus]
RRTHRGMITEPNVSGEPGQAPPAELLETAGADVLRRALADSPSLASALIDARVDAYTERLDTVEGQVLATRHAAEVIAATPTTSWPAHLTHLVVRTNIAPDIAMSEVFDADQRRAGAARGRQETGTANTTVGPDGATLSGATRPSTTEESAEMPATTLRAAQRAALGTRRPAWATPGQRR